MPISHTLASEEEIVRHWNGNREPVVSVLCPTYNHVNFISISLESILSQRTNFPFEVLVRDDASTDGSQDIIRQYEEKYPLIIKGILKKENTFSKGERPTIDLTRRANGKYLAICEGDDYWGDPSKLQKQVEYLEANPDCVLTFHDAAVVDASGAIIKPSILEGNKKHYSKEELLFSGIIPNLTRCFRNCIEEYPEEFQKVRNGDTFAASLMSQSGYAKFLDDVKPAYYRKHDGGIWTGISATQKRLDVANTFYWLAAYYGRIGKTDCAEKLSNASIHNILLGLNFSRTEKFKLFLKNFLKSFWALIRTGN